LRLNSAICLALMFNVSAFGAIFGDGDAQNGIEDQRQLAPRKILQSVGTIYCDGALRGTATHVSIPSIAPSNAASIILTAAHVIYHKNTEILFETCVYRPQGKRLGSIDFVKTSAHRFDPHSSDRMQQATQDIVFIALKKKLRGSGLTLQAKEDADNELQLIGYNQNKDHISVSDDCREFSSEKFANNLLLLHNCDAGRGASGGPILDPTSGSVIAVHGGTLVIRSGNNQPLNIMQGAIPDPEALINQGRKIDSDIIARLKRFTAYPAKNSQH
jgi:V8-like Glu-specific endopeptidase